MNVIIDHEAFFLVFSRVHEALFISNYVGWFICRSVGRFVRRSVGQLVGHAVDIEAKRVFKMHPHVTDAFLGSSSDRG